MRAVIYARFSTELQSVASIDDQARVCRERATGIANTLQTFPSRCWRLSSADMKKEAGAIAPAKTLRLCAGARGIAAAAVYDENGGHSLIRCSTAGSTFYLNPAGRS